MVTLKLGRTRFVHLSLSAATEHDRDTNEYKQFGSFSSQSYPNAVGLRSLAPPPQRYEGELRIADGYLMRVNKERCDRPRWGRDLGAGGDPDQKERQHVPGWTGTFTLARPRHRQGRPCMWSIAYCAPRAHRCGPPS